MRPKGRPSNWLEKARLAAARRALRHVRPGQVVGLGSGSTVALAVQLLGRKSAEMKRGLKVIPTSHQIEMAALDYGLSVITLNEAGKADLTIDGADQIEGATLNLIKGGGGALAREKVLAHNSDEFIVIADESKLVDKLGDACPVPVEVLPYAHRSVARAAGRLGGRSRLREGVKKVGPVVTDNGNFILDIDFDRIRNPYELDRRLKSIPGVVETGLFLDLADIVYLGRRSGKVAKLS